MVGFGIDFICYQEQWLRSQGIFNKDASDEDPVATGKMGSPLSIPQAQQPSPMSTKKVYISRLIRSGSSRPRLNVLIHMVGGHEWRSFCKHV